MSRLKKTKNQDLDWVVWDSEGKSIVFIGSELYTRNYAAYLNEIYQTDAYRAQEFKFKERSDDVRAMPGK